MDSETILLRISPTVAAIFIDPNLQSNSCTKYFNSIYKKGVKSGDKSRWKNVP